MKTPGGAGRKIRDRASNAPEGSLIVRLVELALAVISLFFCDAALAQRSVQDWYVGPEGATITVSAPRATLVIANAPYSADEVTEYTPTPDELRQPLSSDVSGHYFRDSQGRTRTENAQKPAPVWITEIIDPVAGIGYILDDQKKIAHRMVLLAPAPRQANAISPGAKIESLGTRTIEGLECEGTRNTEGSFHGTPFAVDTWISPELHVTMLEKSVNGYSVRLTKVLMGEPDPSRFQPPLDYTIIDETGSFTMTIKVR
jgi:hypothetical protein